MSIQPISGVTAGLLDSLTGVGAAGQVGQPGQTDAVSALAGTTGTSGTGAVFGADLAGSIDQLQALQSTSDALAVKAVTGDLDDVHDYTIASSQAAVTLELTAALRNKAVEAFSEIMRMQA